MKENPRFNQKPDPNLEEETQVPVDEGRVKPLTLREYLGVLRPEQPPRREEDSRPLTIKEYISVTPMLNVSEIVDLSKRAAKGLKQAWQKVSRKTS